jgi:Xaa-Pro dipeptidase
MKQRLQQLINWMQEKEMDVCFVSSKENVFYFSGFRSEPHERLLGLLVFQQSEPILICPAMEQNDVKNAGWEYEIIGYQDTENPWDIIQQKIHQRLPKQPTWGIEKVHLNVERYEEIMKRFPNVQFVSAEEKLRELRMIKDDQELAAIRKAAALADFAIETGVNAIYEGATELEIIATIEYELKKKGVTEMSFSTMVLTGANAASPHGTPGLTKIKKGDLVLFDLGVVYDGYCSDITRTVAFGDISEEQKAIYETVRKAEETAVVATKPGVTASHLDQIARQIIHEAGYGDFFPHRLGHGLGISVHEYPSITSTNELTIQKGMVFTIEPGIYVPNVAGVRIEDDVYVTEAGVEVLTKYPKELKIIE